MKLAISRSRPKRPPHCSKSSASDTSKAASRSPPILVSVNGAKSSTTPTSPAPCSTGSSTAPSCSTSTATATACAPTEHAPNGSPPPPNGPGHEHDQKTGRYTPLGATQTNRVEPTTRQPTRPNTTKPPP